MIGSIILYNVTTTAALLWMITKNPRMMLQDYPQEIIEIVPPKTEKEKKDARLYGLPFLGLLFFYPLAAGFYTKFNTDYSFYNIWVYVFSLLISFNVFDLLVIDWLIFCTITPTFIVIPGTERHPAYKDYRFHFTAFLKGTVFSILGSIIFAALIEAVYFITQQFN